MSRRSDAAEQGIIRFAAQVAERIDAVVEKLDTVAAEALSAAGDFDCFVKSTRELLAASGKVDALAGAGYAVAYEGSGDPPAMVWWVHRGESVAERTHSVDSESETFYDYASLRWFRTAVVSGGPTLSGPFIDTWGSDDYTVTVSLPVPGPSGPRGVVAVDVDVRRLIESLTADLQRMTTPVALVNESDRVVVSTLPSLSTGLPIRSRAARNDPDYAALQRFPVSDYGWSVVPLTA
jgi:hypothetical protein